MKITDEQIINILTRLKNHGETKQERIRSHAILLSHQGKTSKELAEIFSVSQRTIFQWFKDFNEHGCKSLCMQSGRGRKRLLDEEKDKERIKQHIELYPHQPKKAYLQYNKFVNLSTKEQININYDFEKKYKEYSKITEQRAYTIQELSKRKEFCSVFITLTLPSQFHPFKSIATSTGRLYVEDNKDFIFSSIKEAVSHGYKELNTIYQTFYKTVIPHDFFHLILPHNA